MSKEGSELYVMIYEFILFNLKFHYLSVEGKKVCNDGDREGMKSLLEEYGEMKWMYEKSKVRPFCVMWPGDLRGYVERMMEKEEGFKV